MEEIFTHELTPGNITPQEFARGTPGKRFSTSRTTSL
jgi:hypothetical protein